MGARLPIMLMVTGVSGLLVVGAAGGSGSALAAARVTGNAVAPVPRPGQSSTLNAVAAVTARDAWTVGSYCPSHCKASPTPERYMILHWNGTAWSLKVKGSSGSLAGVSAASAKDVWAVGESSGTPLFLHWNGTKWSRGKAAAFPPGAGLQSVDTLSQRSAWAVGSAFSAKIGAYITLVAHWNGRKWSRVAAPPLTRRGGQAGLSTVSAVSAKDVWAAGDYCASSCATRQPVIRGVILHWNGAKWSQSPLPVTNAFRFFVVDALSRSDAWALGLTISAGFRASTLLLHWNGTRWLKVAIPVFPSAMTFVSPSDAWAVGMFQPALHWNGTKWTQGQVLTPNWAGFINAASGDAANDVWVVGERCTASCLGGIPISHGIIAHWNGSKWSLL